MTLKNIYTLFIGVLMTTFIGVGIAAFYESPKPPEYSIEETIPIKSPELNNASQSSEVLIRQDKAYRAYQKLNQIYNRNVAIITSIFAIILLTVSLTLMQKLDILSDGLLLGGLFTQLYSIIRGFESQDNKFRFVVVSVGLVAALIIGYIKFIKQKKNVV